MPHCAPRGVYCHGGGAFVRCVSRVYTRNRVSGLIRDRIRRAPNVCVDTCALKSRPTAAYRGRTAVRRRRRLRRWWHGVRPRPRVMCTVQSPTAVWTVRKKPPFVSHPPARVRRPSRTKINTRHVYTSQSNFGRLIDHRMNRKQLPVFRGRQRSCVAPRGNF